MEVVEGGFLLKSRVLFFDSCIYHSNNYQFLSKDLESLGRLLKADQATLLFTTITVLEIKRHLREQASQAASAVQSLQQKGKVLRNLPNFASSVMFDSVHVSDLARELINRFEKFLETPNVEVVSVNTVSADYIFNNYFEIRPPFSVKKPDEFRDAFVLEALKDYAQENSTRIHVVSTDSDMKEFCSENPQLIWSSKLGEVVNALMHSARAEPSVFADQAYSAVKNKVLDIVTEYLSEQDFGVLDESDKGIQGFSSGTTNLRSINQRVFSADRTSARYGVDFEFDVVAKYFQSESSRAVAETGRDGVEIYSCEKRFTKTVEVVLVLEYYEDDISSVYIEDWDIELPGGDILWDDECEEVIRRKAFEF